MTQPQNRLKPDNTGHPKKRATAASPLTGVEPPAECRFRKGRSGNPGGRPRWKPMSDAYKRLGAMGAEKLKAYEPKNGFEAAAKGQFLAAAAGKTQAATEIADRAEGRVPQESKIEANLGGEMSFEDILLSRDRAPA